jgi:hypothetical protein
MKAMGSSPSTPTSDHSTLRLGPQGPYLRLQSVTIFVRDLDRSVQFYVDQLGFNLIFDARTQSHRPFVGVAPQYMDR